MELVPEYDDSPSYDETTTQFCDETLYFAFEGKYWNRALRELKRELERRPHVNIHGSKDFRKWKIQYKKQLKK